MPLLVSWLALLHGPPCLGRKLFVKFALAGACSVLLPSHPQKYLAPSLCQPKSLFGVVVLVLHQKREHYGLSTMWEGQVSTGEVQGRAKIGDLRNSKCYLERKRKQPVLCFVFLWSIVEGRWGDAYRREDDPEPYRSTMGSVYQQHTFHFPRWYSYTGLTGTEETTKKSVACIKGICSSPSWFIIALILRWHIWIVYIHFIKILCCCYF